MGELFQRRERQRTKHRLPELQGDLGIATLGKFQLDTVSTKHELCSQFYSLADDSNSRAGGGGQAGNQIGKTWTTYLVISNDRKRYPWSKSYLSVSNEER